MTFIVFDVHDHQYLFAYVYSFGQKLFVLLASFTDYRILLIVSYLP